VARKFVRRAGVGSNSVVPGEGNDAGSRYSARLVTTGAVVSGSVHGPTTPVPLVEAGAFVSPSVSGVPEPVKSFVPV